MFLIELFKQYKLHLPLTEEFVEQTFAEMDKDNDHSISLAELHKFMDSFLKTLLAVFEDALKQHPEKMVRVEAYSLAELETILNDLKALEADIEKTKAQAAEYFAEFDKDNSGQLDNKELTNLVKEYFTRQGLQIPFDKNFIDAWFVDLDVDKSGKINLQELTEMMEGFNSMLVRMYTAAIEAKRNMK